MNLQRRLFTTFRPTLFRATVAPQQLKIHRTRMSDRWLNEHDQKAQLAKESKRQQRLELKQHRAENGLVIPTLRTPLTPSLIDLRVGQITTCIDHPNADHLLIFAITLGDAPASHVALTSAQQLSELSLTPPPSPYPPRVITAALLDFYPNPAELVGRRVVVATNLAHMKFRGVRSAGVVLVAATEPVSEEAKARPGRAELVVPPEGAEVGERLCFEGFEGGEEGVLEGRAMRRRDLWTRLARGMVVREGGVVFDTGRLREAEGEGMGEGMGGDRVGRLVRAGKGVEGGVVTATLEGARIK